MAEIFEVNIDAQIAAMASDSKFTDIKDGETKVFRFAPSVHPEGIVLYMTFNHYKMKDPTATNRAMALADLRYHGNEKTGREDYVARFVEAVLKHGDTEEEKAQLAQEKKVADAIKGNKRYYAQGWEGIRMEDNSFKWSNIKLIALAKTPADDVVAINKSLKNMGEPMCMDPDGGQPLLITRTGSGFATKYRVERSGRVEALDDIIPGWKDQLYPDVYEALGLKVFTPEEQKKVVKFSYPDLDWDFLEKEFGL